MRIDWSKYNVGVAAKRAAEGAVYFGGAYVVGYLQNAYAFEPKLLISALVTGAFAGLRIDFSAFKSTPGVKAG